jgi:hypothetical protein
MTSWDFPLWIHIEMNNWIQGIMLDEKGEG